MELEPKPQYSCSDDRNHQAPSTDHDGGALEVIIDAPIANPTKSEKTTSKSIDSLQPSVDDTTQSRRRSVVSVAVSRFHAGYFRISLSLSIQALLWKTMTKPPIDANAPLHVLHKLPSLATTLLWSLSLLTLVTLSSLYTLRCIFHMNRVKREFLHHVGVNYMYVPWISSLLLLRSSPFSSSYPTNHHTRAIYDQTLWWIFALPIIALDIKIYGQYFTKGKRYLSRVANPTNQLSVIGNLIGARTAVVMGWNEFGLFMFSLGLVHYLVLFVTLYQRLPGSNVVPLMLRPVFFLFIATPSVASLAWGTIAGSFDDASKMLFFLSLFLFFALVCRPALFKKSMKKFSVAWWAYSFPLTALALASIEYDGVVKTPMAHGLMLLLSFLSILITFLLMILTVVNLNYNLFYDVITSSSSSSSSSTRSSSSSSFIDDDDRHSSESTTATASGLPPSATCSSTDHHITEA